MRLSSRFHAHPSSRRSPFRAPSRSKHQPPSQSHPRHPAPPNSKNERPLSDGSLLAVTGRGGEVRAAWFRNAELLLANDSGREFQVFLYLLLEKFFRERACFEWAVAVACYWSGLCLLYPMTKGGGKIFSAELNPAVSRLFREWAHLRLVGRYEERLYLPTVVKSGWGKKDPDLPFKHYGFKGLGWSRLRFKKKKSQFQLSTRLSTQGFLGIVVWTARRFSDSQISLSPKTKESKNILLLENNAWSPDIIIGEPWNKI